MEKHYLFKQALRFDYPQKAGDKVANKRKVFGLGIHSVPSEVEKLDHFKLMVKHGLIVEHGAMPPLSQHDAKMKALESHKKQAQAKLEEKPQGEAPLDPLEVAEADSSGEDSDEELNAEQSSGEAESNDDDKKENRKNKKNRR